MMTPEQSASILARMFGYSGPTDQRSIDQFLAANPAAAASINSEANGGVVDAQNRVMNMQNTGEFAGFRPEAMQRIAK
jgi:hypothetical protein